jgi:hypothetical protein
MPPGKLVATAESKGGIEYYLIEQEGSRFPPLDSAELCLKAFKEIHG